MKKITIEEFDKINTGTIEPCDHCGDETVTVYYTVPPMRAFSCICRSCFQLLVVDGEENNNIEERLKILEKKVWYLENELSMNVDDIRVVLSRINATLKTGKEVKDMNQMEMKLARMAQEERWKNKCEASNSSSRVKPITPDEVIKLKKEKMPNKVMEVFNELIAINWDGCESVFKTKEALDKIASAMKISSKDVIDNRYLDVIEIYRENGWSIELDKPGFNENYDAVYKFRKRKQT